MTRSHQALLLAACMSFLKWASFCISEVYATRRATFGMMMKHRQGWDTVGVAYLSKTFPFRPVGVTVGFGTWWGKVRTHFKVTLVSVQGLSQRENDKGYIKEGKDNTRQYTVTRKLLVLVGNKLPKSGWVGKRVILTGVRESSVHTDSPFYSCGAILCIRNYLSETQGSTY